ncbi:MAG: hypothetical protein HFF28_07955 [Oscillospiraceae bacterium]|nr:hypothetical protein [Oscillospiraceae bacterium]
MGEIVYSILIGGLLVLSGIFMNLYLKHEEDKWASEDETDRKEGGT